MNSIILDKALKKERLKRKHDGNSLKVGFYRTVTPVNSSLPVLHLSSVTKRGVKPAELLCRLQTKLFTVLIECAKNKHKRIYSSLAVCGPYF